MSDTPFTRLRLLADGDSILSNDLWARFALDAAEDHYELPDRYNQAVGGATTKQVLDKIDDVIRMSPDVVALHVGTNDLSSTVDTPAETYRNISEICRFYIDHGIRYVIVVCVLPRCDYYWTQLGPRRNDRTALNALLRRMTRDSELAAYGNRIRVVDVESSFDPIVRTADGLHLSLTGARMLGRAIGHHLARIAAPPRAERRLFGSRRRNADGRFGWLSRVVFGRSRSRSAI